MTTPIELDDSLTGEPEPGDGGRRAARRPRRRRGERPGGPAGGLRWPGSCVALLLLHDPGRMTFDTKLGVDIDPVGFYGRLWHLWNPLEWFGGLQDQYIGYAFPMGAFYLLGHAAARARVAGRAAVDVAAGRGRLPGAWCGWPRRSASGPAPTRLLAGAVFALWPTFTIVIGSTSAAVLPGMLRAVGGAAAGPGAGRRPRGWPRPGPGVVVLCMGGVNAVSTLAALVLPGLYLLTAARAAPPVADRVVGARGAAGHGRGGWCRCSTRARYGFNFLPYIEQARTTTQTMSAAAVLRGSGNWAAYLNFGPPWLTAGWVLVGSAWPIAAGARSRPRRPGRAGPPRPARGDAGCG